MGAQTTNGRFAIMKALFYFITVLVLGTVGYAAWIVVSYWDRVGV